MSEESPEYVVQTEEPEAQPAPAPKPKRQKLVAVRRIARQGDALCVQYQDGDWTRRAWVPVKEVDSDKVSADVLAEGVPVGIRWEERLDMALDLKALAKALYRYNMFTKDDLGRKAQAMAAIREAIGPIYLHLLKIAAKEE